MKKQRKIYVTECMTFLVLEINVFVLICYVLSSLIDRQMRNEEKVKRIRMNSCSNLNVRIAKPTNSKKLKIKLKLKCLRICLM